MKKIGVIFSLAVSSICIGISLIAMENSIDAVAVQSFISQGNLEAFQSCNLAQFDYPTIKEFEQTISRQFETLGWAEQLCEHSALFNEIIVTLEKVADENAKQQPLYGRAYHGYRFIENELDGQEDEARCTVLGIIKEAVPFAFYYDDLVAVMQLIEHKEDKKIYIETLLHNAKVMGKKVEEELSTYEINWLPSGRGYTYKKKNK